MILRFHKHFVKAYRKVPRNIQKRLDQRLSIFLNTPFAIDFNNHALIGKYKGYRSIDITGDYRALYKEISEREVVFVQLGTHAQL